MSAQVQEAVHVEPSGGMDIKAPPLAALFLIEFDVKIGYMISWKQSAKDVPLEGIVEYKSLPSGLHNVDEDLVYFCHETYSGISAFIKGKASAELRNAHFVAVGAMLRLKDGRLGRAWLHAQNLQNLARAIVDNTKKTDLLQEYWDEHRAPSDQDDFTSPQLSPFTLAQRKSRALSTATLSGDDHHTLPSLHPALSILEYLDFFGPLIFPLHRAALLRQRILFVTTPPIKQACEFVYDLSIFATTPLSLANSLILPFESMIRLRPLFTIGIHDIPMLEQMATPPRSPPESSRNSSTGQESGLVGQEHDEEQLGWVACTTDEILVMKTKLYDIVVEFPATHLVQGKKKKRLYPVIKSAADGKQIKATQRDLRRFRLLSRALRPIKEQNLEQSIRSERERLGGDGSTEEEALLKTLPGQYDEDGWADDGDTVESSTWSELAYSSFIWWASAGEKDENQIEEEKLDLSMLGDLEGLAEEVADDRRYHDDDDEMPESPSPESTTLVQSPISSGPTSRKDARIEIAIISYFSRLTRNIFEVASDISQNHSAGRDPHVEVIDDDEGVRRIDRDEMRSMGLDVWSGGDREFVRCLFELWFQRRVRVEGVNVECCGIKIC